MALENTKKFITMMWEDEALQDRTANRNEEEVMAVAKELGLAFTADELKEAAGTHELSPGEMEPVSGGSACNAIAPGVCPKNRNRGHSWLKTGHYEDKWFTWIKEDGLFSIEYDIYKCTYCGLTKNKST